MVKCFITKFLGEFDNENLPFYDTFVIHVTPNIANVGNWSARAINFLSPKDIVISTKDGGNHIAYVIGDYIGTEPTNLTNKVTVPANTKAGVYMKDDVEYDVLVSGLYSFTYIGSTNGGSSPSRGFVFDINQLSNSTNLQTLNMVATKGAFSGDIASFVGLTNLQTINLVGSQISGDIASLKNLTNLQTLNLGYSSQISGDIASLKNLTNLQTLGMNDTNISGDITELKTLVNATALSIRPTTYGAITGDVKELFDAMAMTNRNNTCLINWDKTACTYSGDTSMTPLKKFINATFNGNGGYTVTNYTA
jgi:hypothetical protein